MRRGHRPFLVILCGIPSSGKSSLAEGVAENLEKKHRIPTAVVSSDAFRNMVPTYSYRFEHDLEQFVRDATYETIDRALRRGLVVISDDTNYYASIRKRLVRISERSRAGYAIVYVNTPLEAAVKWNSERGEPIPNSLIEEIHAKLDEPGTEYRWDKPFLTVDPSKNDTDELAELVSTKIHGKITVKEKGPAQRERKRKAPPAKALERETRRAMSEIVKRFKDVSLAPEISELRRGIVREAIKRELEPAEAVKLFFDEAQILLSRRTIEAPEGRVIVHVGLFGHVDHGKTQLAACLSEKLSTASLDKHPEAQRRGMSIDIGFSAFSLGNYLVTLVDHPGHYSLIKHVMAGASIIDAGILVVAADEGPMVQTLEHLQILNALDIESLVVAINKVDLVDGHRLDLVREEVREILKETRFPEAPMVSISALRCEGIEELKDTLLGQMTQPVRQWMGSLKMPISHAFNIAGIGTVVTGTVLRGKVGVKDVVEVQPSAKRARVKFVQIFGEETGEAVAGERAALALTDVRASDFSRGYYIVSPGTLSERSLLVVRLHVERRFGQSILARSLVHVNIGMQTVTGKIFPYSDFNEVRVLMRKVDPSTETMALIKLEKPAPVEVGDKALLIKIDLPPKRFRVIGLAEVLGLPLEAPKIFSAKIKRGRVEKRAPDGLYVVSGLFQSRVSVEHLLGQNVVTDSRIRGTIMKPYGEDGDLKAEFESAPNVPERVYYYRLRDVKVV